MWNIRTYLGNMMGSLEAWLLLRSLRTLHLRVPRQSENAYGLAQWLSKAAGVCLRHIDYATSKMLTSVVCLHRASRMTGSQRA